MESINTAKVIEFSNILLGKLVDCKESSIYDLQIHAGLDEMGFYASLGYLIKIKKVSLVYNNGAKVRLLYEMLEVDNGH